MLYPRGGGEGSLAGHSKGDAVAQVFSISILISVGDTTETQIFIMSKQAFYQLKLRFDHKNKAHAPSYK